MTDRTISTADAGIDASVRDAYRESATESAPANLDSAIVQLSRQTMRPLPGLTKPVFWARPLAFAAMAVLCFAAILQFREDGSTSVTPELPAANVNDQAGGSGIQTESLSEAVQSTGQKLRELDEGAESLTSSNNPAPQGAATSDFGLDAGNRTAVETPSFCDTVAKASAETWWRCIEELRRDGMANEARSELDLFKSLYSSFIPAR